MKDSNKEFRWGIIGTGGIADAFAKDLELSLIHISEPTRPERISKSLKEKIEKAIPNRIRYFDNKNFNMYPMEQKDER